MADSSTGSVGNRGWVVVALGFLALSMTFAARSSVSMVIPLWEVEMGWTRTLSATGSSLVLAMMALGSPIAGNLMDRYGPRLIFAAGLTAIAIGLAGTGFATEPVHYLVLFGLVGGAGWAAVSIPMVTGAVSGYFTKKRGLAIGIAISGATGGQLPVLSLLGIVVASLGWRDAFVWLGALLAALAVLVYLRLKPHEQAPNAPVERVPEADALFDRLRFLFSNRTFLLLFGAFSLCGFTTAGVIDVHFIPYAISCGYSLVESTGAYGVHGLGNLVGVVALSWLADHVHRPRLLAAIFFLRALMFVFLFYIASDITMMYLFAGIFGILNFATFPIIANIMARQIGVRIIGLTLGLLFGGHSLGAAIGAVMGGWLFDQFARYDGLWWVSVFLAAMAGVFAILVRETPEEPRADAPAEGRKATA